MSAYFVSETTIDLMVSAAIEFEIYARLTDKAEPVKVTGENATAFGKMLLSANAASLQHRYAPIPLDQAAGYMATILGYRFRRYLNVTPAGAFGCADCFDYQACEPNDYHLTPAHAFAMQVMRGSAKRAIGENYPWGINEPAKAREWAQGPVTSIAIERDRVQKLRAESKDYATRSRPTTSATVTPIAKAAPKALEPAPVAPIAPVAQVTPAPVQAAALVAPKAPRAPTHRKPRTPRATAQQIEPAPAPVAPIMPSPIMSLAETARDLFRAKFSARLGR